MTPVDCTRSSEKDIKRWIAEGASRPAKGGKQLGFKNIVALRKASWSICQLVELAPRSGGAFKQLPWQMLLRVEALHVLKPTEAAGPCSLLH